MHKRFFSICVALVALMVTPLAAWALNVSPGNVSGGPGASITVPINISDVGGGLAVDAFDFTINFDPDVLTFVEADKTGTLTNSFTTVAGNIIGPGQVKVAGILFGTPINISSPGVFVNIKFTVKATAYKNSPLSLSDFKSDIAGASSTPATFTITGVTVTVNLTPSSVNDVVAGEAVPLTAQVVINGTPLELTNPNDVNFATSGGGTFGAKSVVAGDVVVNYTTPALIQTATITATETVTGNNREDTSTISSIAGPLAVLTVSPDTATLTADETRQFSVTGVDANNNPVTGSGLGTITWTVNGGIGTIDNNGLLAATTVGTGSITATSSVGSVSDTSGNITVTAGAVANLVISPAGPVSLTADETQLFTVSGTDADGNPAAIGDITWSVNGAIGTVDAGLFAATTVGTGTVTATSSLGAAVTSGEITVTPGAATKMTLTASRTTLASDGKGTATLTARILDQKDNLVTSDNATAVTFTLTDPTYVTITGSPATASGGVATATVTTKSGTVTVPPGGSATTGVNITSAPVLTPPAAVPDLTLTIADFSIQVDSPAAPFVDATGVHLVTSASTPSSATLQGVGGSSGFYRWALTGVGSISSATADTITYTAPASITGASQTSKLTLTSAKAGDEGLTNDINIFIYNPVAVTWPASAAGIAIGDNSKKVTASGGKGPYAFQGSNDAVATVGADGTITPVAVGTLTVKVRDTIYGNFDTTNGFLAGTAQIEIVEPIVVTPATTDLLASETQQFAAAGGKGDGAAANYTWSVNNAGAGSINANGLFTAANVAAAQTATITATDKTYTNILGTATVNVYPTLTIKLPEGYDPNNPATWPLVLSGGTYSLQVAGGEGSSYTWTVDGPVEVPGGTGNAFEFVAPTEGAFAGVYAVTVTDDQTGKTFSINMKVPMTITPSNLSMLGDSTLIYEFDVAGAPEGSSFAVSLVTTGKAEIANPDEYGTVTYNPDELFNAEALAGFDFTPADITGAYKSFLFKVQATEVVNGNGAPLKDAGLDILYSGVMNILPVVEFTGRVENADGDPIENVDVKVLLGDDVVEETTTDDLGEFSFKIADPASIGQITVVFTAAGYVTQAVPLEGWVNPKVIVLVAAAGSVSGNVSEFEGGPIAGALVESALDDQVLAAVTDNDGNYTLGLPRALAEGEVLNARASKSGYVAVVQDVALNPDFILNPQSEGPEQEVCEAGGTFEWDSAIVKIPAGALDGCYTIEVNDNIPVGTETLYTEKSVVLIEIKIPPAALPLGKPIIVTMPYDTAEVQPGDFAAGRAVIYHAPTVDDLRNGTNLKKVATSDIISQDPFSGLVTFQVSDFSVFGIGGAQAAPTPTPTPSGGGGGGGCFIASMDDGSASHGGLAGLAFLAIALGVVGTWTARRSAK